MAKDTLLVKDYLETLREDGELDRIFPTLLSLMGFRIISPPNTSKGQSQYGKDVVALHTDSNGIKKRYYFELKGYADKDITDNVLNKPDGVIESLRAALYTKFPDTGIEGFDNAPIQYVLVHNGIMRANAMPTFEGFKAKEFPEGNLERWDIEQLTELFSQYLFSEYLLTEPESVHLLKKTIVLLDVPEYDLQDFKNLVDKVLDTDVKSNKRALAKKFATLNLLCGILYHYAAIGGNVTPAKNGINFLILHTWSWILRHHLEERKPILNQFRKLLARHYSVLAEFFEKTIPAARLENGLASETGGIAETVLYPLRAQEWLSEYVYFNMLKQYHPLFNGVPLHEKATQSQGLQKDELFDIIAQNDGCTRPLIDRHSLPILLTTLFVMRSQDITNEDFNRLHRYFVSVIENINLIRVNRQRFPELYDRVDALVEFAASNERPFDYDDSASMLLMILLELLALVDSSTVYLQEKSFLQGKIDLQTTHPNLSEHGNEFEQAYFHRQVHDLMYSETSIELPDNLASLKERLRANPGEEVNFRTDRAGFRFLKYLAAIYFKNDLFPRDWRQLIIDINAHNR